MQSTVTEFRPGKTYATRSICDHDCIISITVLNRTAKTIRTTEGKLFRISYRDGLEFVRPWGTYSMAPIIDAKDNRTGA
jgi:hypothetical protein